MSTPDSIPELLPCPFCGADSAAFVTGDCEYTCCDTCLAEGPPCDTQEEAARLWNTRTPVQPVSMPLSSEVEVTQADREAAAEFVFGVGKRDPAQRNRGIELGEELPIVQAFAAHRLAALASVAQPGMVGEGRVSIASEFLRGIRGIIEYDTDQGAEAGDADWEGRGREYLAAIDEALATSQLAPLATRLSLPSDEKLREALASIIAHFDPSGSDGNAPGHAHDRLGIWDDDAGNEAAGRANKPCEWCATWNRARAALSQPIDRLTSEGEG